MICYEIGHRTKSFSRSEIENAKLFSSLFLEVERLIHSGYSTFISGLADGVDTDFAEIVMCFRDRALYDISLEAALPYINKKSTSKLLYLLSMSDDIHLTSTHFHKGCVQKRNELMVDKADLVLAIWDGRRQGSVWNTIKYAISKGKPVKYILI